MFMLYSKRIKILSQYASCLLPSSMNVSMYSISPVLYSRFCTTVAVTVKQNSYTYMLNMNTHRGKCVDFLVKVMLEKFDVSYLKVRSVPSSKVGWKHTTSWVNYYQHAENTCVDNFSCHGTEACSLFFFRLYVSQTYNVVFYVCAQQCNPGDLRALRKGMTLYHSESQLSSLPQRQEAMHMVSTQKARSHTLIKTHRRDAHSYLTTWAAKINTGAVLVTNVVMV